MVFSNAERQARYRKRLKDRAALEPEALIAAVSQWVEDALAAWNEIQPEDQSWRSFIASRKTTAVALSELDYLTSKDFGDTPEHKAALQRVHRLLEALALRNDKTG